MFVINPQSEDGLQIKRPRYVGTYTQALYHIYSVVAGVSESYYMTLYRYVADVVKGRRDARARDIIVSLFMQAFH